MTERQAQPSFSAESSPDKSCDRSQTEVTAFYDDFVTKLLKNYIYGNPRVEAAIAHTLRSLPENPRRILDLGCGIGWSTWEIKRNYPDAFVLGIDLSPNLIAMAQRLFKSPNLEFTVRDLTEPGAIFDEAFDAIVMLDTYEHISRKDRATVHQFLNKTLTSQGVFIASCPSILHQNYLRTSEPEGLQPVDEDITLEEVAQLSRDLNGTVIYFNNVTIWRTRDYIHFTIARDRPFEFQNQSAQNIPLPLEPPAIRSQRVKSRLQVSEPTDFAQTNEAEKPTICIVSPNENAYSETFIHAHIERLPARIIPLYRNSFPLGQDPRVIRQFFWENKVEALLAEYGPSGVALMEVCEQAGIPLIVHFHGGDAYDRETIAGIGQRYPELFAKAAAIIVVSRDMERQLIGLGAPRETLHYNTYGVDLSRFKGADPAQSPPQFVAVGRFVDKKAPYLSILAFKQVYEDCPEARLVAIGDGPLWEACQQLAQSLGIGEAIEFLGPRSHTEVAEIVARSRAFIQHSLQTRYGDSEGTPVAILEAGAAGLPTVATRHAGITDAIVDGETGLLVDEGDIAGMAAAMLQLTRDPALAGRLGKAARERIAAEFSLDRSIDNLWAIVETAIARSRSRRRLEPLKLRDINLIVFPDWKAPEELILSQLQAVLKALVNHRDRNRITWLIDCGELSETDVNLALGGVVMNLMMEENLEISDELVISPVENLQVKEWNQLFPKLTGKIVLSQENQEAIVACEGEKLVCYKIDDLDDLKFMHNPKA
jgi:glycosyltransferase involved in cell wall biosynthesis